MNSKENSEDFFPNYAKNSASGQHIVQYACGSDGEVCLCAEIGRKIEGERESKMCEGRGGERDFNLKLRQANVRYCSQ